MAVGGIAALLVRQQPPRHPDAPSRVAGSELQSSPKSVRERLFQELQPVALENCELQRFGEVNDGGYLLCGNLLAEVRAAYSYGISGYDEWGCDLSRGLSVPVHRYDCFDTRNPACPGGKAVFHAECVGSEHASRNGRPFDTLQDQIAANGDGPSRLVVKMDVEGAEWDALLQTPGDVLDRFDQLVVEFHKTEDPRFVVVVQKLRDYFHVAHLHFNNHSCQVGLEPFPSWAYEVLFVSKRLGIVDPSARASIAHPLDAPNKPTAPDCQAVPR
jgi:hypothetical protein